MSDELTPEARAVMAMMLALLYVQEDYSAMIKLSDLLSRANAESAFAERFISELQAMSRNLTQPPIDALTNLLS